MEKSREIERKTTDSGQANVIEPIITESSESRHTAQQAACRAHSLSLQLITKQLTL
jgi:hypothetical protein